MEQLKGASIRPADVARRLKLTPSAISMYMNAKGNPSQRSLGDLREMATEVLAARSRGEVIERRAEVRERFNRNLAILEKNDPAAYDSVRRIAEALARGLSLDVLEVAEASAGAALAESLSEDPVAGTSPEAGVPNGDKLERGRDAGSRTGLRRNGRGKAPS